MKCEVREVLCGSFVVQSSTGITLCKLCKDLQYKIVLEGILCKLCSTKYWEVLYGSFVVQSSTGKCLVQAL